MLDLVEFIVVYHILLTLLNYHLLMASLFIETFASDFSGHCGLLPLAGATITPRMPAELLQVSVFSFSKSH